MNYFKRSFINIFLFLLLMSPSAKGQQLVANAGAGHTICPGDSAHLGGLPAATGGLPPYHYSWSPSAYLSSNTVANPYAFPPSYYVYTLTVTDDTGAVATSTVVVGFKYINYVNAGSDVTICKGNSTVLGGGFNVAGQGVVYRWSPWVNMNDSTLPRPTVAPLVSTTYFLTATMPGSGCATKTDAVNVTVIDVVVDAGLDTAIYEGANITLHATGAVHYIWTYDSTLNYQNTPNPDAQPVVTTWYYVTGWNSTWQCANRDSVLVTVHKSGTLVFYNTFTPNGDGQNDTWYIGNIEKYPNNVMKIFNRNGQLVFRQEAYMNTWDGKSFGQDLPAATYFYVLDPGDGSDTYNGTVTIIR
jgi:large repetitive protein